MTRIVHWVSENTHMFIAKSTVKTLHAKEWHFCVGTVVYQDKLKEKKSIDLLLLSSAECNIYSYMWFINHRIHFGVKEP